MDIKKKIISVLDREIEEATKKISEIEESSKSDNPELYNDLEDENNFWVSYKNKILGIKKEMEEFFKETGAKLNLEAACGLNIPVDAGHADVCVARIEQKVLEEMFSPNCSAKEAIRQKICRIVRKKACIPDTNILNGSCDLRDHYALESSEMIEIISEVEEEYGINIPNRDAAKLKSIDEIVSFVYKSYNG